MKKTFDEIILELPEINLNEKKTRYGECLYGSSPLGGCNDQAEIVIYASSGGGWQGSDYDWSNTGASTSGGSSGGGGGSGASSHDVSPQQGEWVDTPCLGCAELEQPRPTFTPLGRYVLNEAGAYHNDGCGGATRPELRNKIFKPCVQ